MDQKTTKHGNEIFPFAVEMNYQCCLASVIACVMSKNPHM